MWRNYLKAGFRHLMKQKLFSAINVVGLALGVASCLVIMLFVRDELSYDQFWPEADSVYQVSWHSQPSGRPPIWLAVTPGPLVPALKADLGEDIQAATRMIQSVPAIIRNGQGIAAATYYVDLEFFNVFQPAFLRGTRATALEDASSMVMTRSAAIKYFGSIDVLGQRVDLDTGRSFTITGVVEDLPDNSQLNYEILAPIMDSDFIEDGHITTEDWGNIGFHTYVKLAPGVTPGRIEESFSTIIDKYAPDWGPDFVASKVWQIELVALEDVHLFGAGRAAIKPKGDVATIYSFSAIAVLILAIACFNFMNLSTARSATRAREVAVRKVLGAYQSDIVQQFMAETAVTVLLAILVALAMVEFALPALNEVLTKMLRLDYAADPLSMAALAALALVTLIGAGLHPAMITARYRPAHVLRSGRAAPAGSVRLRMALVIAQFAISIFLISAAVMVYRQLDHMTKLDKGFNSHNVVWIRDIDHPSIKGSQEALKKRLLDHPDIVAAAYSWTLPGYGGRSYNGIDAVDGQEIRDTSITTRYVDFDYFDTYQVAMLSGRNFDRDRASDVIRGPEGWQDASVIVNQSALAYLGLPGPDQAIGHTLRTDGRTLTIIGVLSDIRVDHSDTGFEPMIYVVDPEIFWRLGLRYRAGDQTIRSTIEAIWKDMFPLVPLRMDYLDETLDAQFAQERERGRVIAVFAGLAVLISLLGLYGLASFSTEQRAKEIGVRKVLGARIRDIIGLLVWQFSKPVMLASLIAWPCAFLFLQGWMEQFPAQVGFGLMAFIGPSLATLMLAWLAVGWHAYRVAGANPVTALRVE